MGNKKPPSAQQLHEGCALVWLDQSGTNAQADYYELSRSVHRPTTVASALVKRQIPAAAGRSGRPSSDVDAMMLAWQEIHRRKRQPHHRW
jgi:hypothetical protein